MAKVLGMDLDRLPKWAPFAILGGVGGLAVFALRPKGGGGTTYLKPLEGQAGGKADIDEGALLDTKIGALGEMLSSSNAALANIIGAQGRQAQEWQSQLLLTLRNNTGTVPTTPTVPGGPAVPVTPPVSPVAPGGHLDPRSPLPPDPNAPRPPSTYYTGVHDGKVFFLGQYVGLAGVSSTPTPTAPVSTPQLAAPATRLGLLGYVQAGAAPVGNYSWIRYNIAPGDLAMLAWAAPWAVGQKIAGWN